MINQSSLEAYEIISPNLNKRQAQILWCIGSLNRIGVYPSNQQIANTLNLQINQVTPRTNELSKFNRIYSIGRKFDGLSKVKVNLWAIRGAI